MNASGSRKGGLTPLPDLVSAAHIPGVYSNLWVQLILLIVNMPWVTYKGKLFSG